MIHLHGHSTYSFLEAIGSPKEIVAKAKKLGMPAIALMDYNGCYGLIDFYLKAKAEEIKPLMGTELPFVLGIQTQIKPEQIGNLSFLAKNEEGYHNLLRLASYANME
jgi:DNA polymerase-3 subunit alpha